MVRHLCIGLALLVVVGCNTQAKWTYPLDPTGLYRSGVSGSRLEVAVLPFQESRPVVNRSATFLLYLIPLVPYGWVTYERPEAARMFNTIGSYEFQLDEDLAKAAVRSLDVSGLFDRVYFTFGGEAENADLVLQGVARRTQYHGKIISYGLSVWGPMLWFIGLPAGTSTNRFEITLSLTNHQREEVWSYTFSGDESITQGLYYNWGNDALNFAALMETGMNRALQDLASKLPDIERAIPTR